MAEAPPLISSAFRKKNEQKTLIHYCMLYEFDQDHTPVEAVENISKAYGTDAINVSQCSTYFERFKEGNRSMYGDRKRNNKSDTKELKRREEEERKEQKKRLEEEKKEQKRLEEEEKKEQKRREEEEKKEQKKRLEEEKKEQKRREEEEREQKKREEEEKREQKRRMDGELMDKKKRQAERFKNFFPKIDPGPRRTLQTTMCNSRFKPFEIKDGMVLAPIYIREPMTTEEYDSFLRCDSIEKSDYLALIKAKKNELMKKLKAKNVAEVVPILAETFEPFGFSEKPKMKLFKFFENTRPAYFGTWRKRSKVITGRRPFTTTEKSLNYEYDSDQDWEDEPSDAEECKSDEEDEKDEEEDADENDGFFVEHGYLSSDEGSVNDDKDKEDKPICLDSEIEAKQKTGRRSTGSENCDANNQQRKHRLAQRAEEWKESQKQKVKKFRKCKIVPTIFGPSWQCDDIIDENLPSSLASLRFESIVIPYNKLIVIPTIDSPTPLAVIGNKTTVTKGAAATVAAK